jgi:hypothetical protein
MDLVEVNPLMDKIKENFHGDIVNVKKYIIIERKNWRNFIPSCGTNT